MTDQVTQEQDQAAQDASLAAGFAKVRGDPPPAEVKPKAEEATEATAEVKAEVPAETPEEKPDPISAQLQTITSKLGMVDQIDHRLRSYEGRLGAINKALEGLAAAKAAAETAVASGASDQAKKVASEKYKAKLDQVAADFPDIGELMEMTREELRAPTVDPEAIKKQLDEAYAQRVAEIQASTRAEIAQEAAKARVYARIDVKHEGWEDTVRSAEFAAWEATQPAEVRALSQSPRAADAIRMLDLYQEARAKAVKAQQQKATNEQRLRNAVQPQGQPVSASQPTSNESESLMRGFKRVRGG